MRLLTGLRDGGGQWRRRGPDAARLRVRAARGDVTHGYRADVCGSRQLAALASQHRGRTPFRTRALTTAALSTKAWSQPPRPPRRSHGTSERPAIAPSLALRWTGCSLSVQRPGGQLAPIPGHADGRHPASTGISSGHLVSSPCEGTLPRLRLGRRYQIPRRAVDLAGNSLPAGCDGGRRSKSTARAYAVSALRTGAGTRDRAAHDDVRHRTARGSPPSVW